MPRTLTLPLTGQIVWYFAASPPAAAPIAALVVASLAGRPVSATASAMTWANGIVTATIPAQSDPVGTIYPITVAGVTPAGYNGNYTGTVTSATTITYPLASNPGPVTVQGTVAYNSGFDGTGQNVEYFNLASFDPTTGAISARAATPFYYGMRPASGAWCTMMRINEPVAGAWPTNLEALSFAEHDFSPQQKQAAQAARVEELKKVATHASPALGPHLGTDTTIASMSAASASAVAQHNMMNDDEEDEPHPPSPHTASRQSRRGR